MPAHSAPHRILNFKLNKKQQKKLIRRSVLAMAVIEPIMTLPQVYQIWINKQAEGVSGLTWGFYIIAAVVWLLYGLQIKDKPLIISSVLWIFMEIAIVVGTIIYS